MIIQFVPFSSIFISPTLGSDRRLAKIIFIRPVQIDVVCKQALAGLSNELMLILDDGAISGHTMSPSEVTG